MKEVPNKIPIRINVDYDFDGRKILNSFKLEDDERIFEIKVLGHRPGASTKAGVQGTIYDVRIMGHQRTLCEEPNDCWSIIKI